MPSDPLADLDDMDEFAPLEACADAYKTSHTAGMLCAVLAEIFCKIYENEDNKIYSIIKGNVIMKIIVEDIGGGNKITDILFHTDSQMFSYRVAGILIYENKILLQEPTNDEGYAFPGGHVAFGETNAETLYREFKEEMGIDVFVNGLKWVGEIFFPLDNKPCHQICLYYLVGLKNKSQIQLSDKFTGIENMEDREFNIEFHWIAIEDLGNIPIYPTNAVELFKHFNEGVQHFVYKESQGHCLKVDV
jgi:ADP-ribose pyrophosphatase YjhB (NUDIX family)